MKSRFFQKFLVGISLLTSLLAACSCGELPVEAARVGASSPSEIILRKDLIDATDSADTEDEESRTAEHTTEDELFTGTYGEETGEHQTDCVSIPETDSVEIIQAETENSYNTEPAEETESSVKTETPVSVPPEVSEEETSGGLTEERTVYWVPGGSVWHTRRDCPSLSRSREVLSGTEREAIGSGKDRACKRCGG